MYFSAEVYAFRCLHKNLLHSDFSKLYRKLDEESTFFAVPFSPESGIFFVPF